MFVVPLLPARRRRLGLVSARPEQRRRRSRAFDRARVFGYFICSRFGGLSLSLSLSVFSSFDSFFDVMNAFFDTTRREEECLLPKCSRKVAGGGRVELPRARDASLRLSVSVCISFFAVSLRRSRTKIKNTFFFCRFQSGVLVGATFMSRQILHSPGFYASREERKRGIDEPVQEKRVRGQKWYKHRVRRYFEERNKTKAPGELLPWLNAMFAPIHQPYDDVVGRKRT